MRRLLRHLLFLAACSVATARPEPMLFLEIDLAIERGGTTGLIFDFGDGYWGENGISAAVPPGTTPAPVRLALPPRPIRALRFDPTADDQPVLISRIRLLDEAGRELLRIDPRALRPMHQIESIAIEAEGVRVRPLPKADDPMLRLDIAPLQKRIHEVTGRATVGKLAVFGLGLLLAAMVGLTLVAAWRGLSRGVGVTAILGAAGIFCTVFGARLMGLNLFSRAAPFWDEWEGDALYVVIPFVGGFLDWGALVMPQWEHRILLTRVVTLFGTLLNGEWDVRVAMTVSAAMFAATITLVGTALVATHRRSAAIVAVVLAVGAALPFDFNNVLWGGQTQMYGLVLLATCAIALAAVPVITPLVLAGAATGGLISLFTMGAGPVGPACGVGICLLRAWFEPAQRRALLGLAAIFFGAALLGVFLHVSSRAHGPLYATSAAQFHRALVGVLAWPLPPRIAWAAVLWAPWVVNGIGILRRREANALEWMAAGLGTWGLINAIALGYARQYEGPPFDSRFFTSFSVGALGSLCSSVAWALRARSNAGRIGPSLAAAAALLGLGLLGAKGIDGARESRATRGDMENRIRTFLATGNPAPVVEKPSHHTGADVVARLESPLLQQVLPAAYRKALAQRPPDAGSSDVKAGLVTLTVRTLMKCGPVIAALGLIGCGLAIVKVRRAESAARGNAGVPPASGKRQAGRLRHSACVTEDRLCYAIAALIVIGWLFIYHASNPHGLVDEPGHLAALHHFLAQQSGWPEAMPMLPGYHFIVLSLWKLWPHLSTLAMARLVTALITLVGFAAFALAVRRIHGQPAGRALLLLALLPLTQPFTAMAYTDVPALAFAFVAWWAQLTGRRAFAALVLVGAVALRQTNLIWAGFFVLWEFFRDDEPRRTFLRRIAWLVLLLATAAILIFAAGRLTVGSQHGNEFKFNVASIHFAAWLVLALGLPVWLAHLPATLARWREAGRSRPARAAATIAAALIAVVTLTFTFENPHIWNREVFWEGCTFTLLRNWPLIWADFHLPLRIASAANVVAMAIAVALVFARQKRRRELWLVTVIGSVPVLTNSLVEPRYLIPLAGFWLCFLELDSVTWRRLAIWWAVLTAAHAPFVAKALSLW